MQFGTGYGLGLAQGGAGWFALAGAEGVSLWLDPSDLTTMFQDTAGATPVTTPGQPVGLIRDKSGYGRHFDQATAGKRPIYGREPSTGRRNLQISTENFPDTAAWVRSACTLSVPATAAPARGGAYGRVTSTGAFSCLRSTAAFDPLTQYTISGTVKKVSGSVMTVVNEGNTTFRAQLNFDTGAVVAVGSCTASAVLVGVGEYFFRVTFTTGAVATNTFLKWWVGVYAATSTVGEAFDLAGPQIELGPAATAYQKVGASRYDVAEPSVRNLLLRSNEISVSPWSGVNMVVATGAPGFDGPTSGFRLTRASAVSNSYQQISGGNIASATYTASIIAKAGNSGGLMGLRAQGSYPRRGDALFDLMNGTIIGVASGGSNTNTTATITPLGNGFYRCTVTTTFVISESGTVTLVTGPTQLTSVTGWESSCAVSDVIAGNAQLEIGAAATAYQRVGASRSDMANAAVPIRHYLSFDGVDDAMQSPVLTLNSDKVQVLAAVTQENRVSATDVLLELGPDSSANDGSFLLAAQAAGSIKWRSRGTAAQDADAALGSPAYTAILTAFADIGAGVARLKRDKVAVAENLNAQGSAVYRNDRLYLGARGGATLPFMGQVYGLFVGFGVEYAAADFALLYRALQDEIGVAQ